jgi:hypothetical protein
MLDKFGKISMMLSAIPQGGGGVCLDLENNLAVQTHGSADGFTLSADFSHLQIGD